MKQRSLEYENKFRKYLFSFDLETHLNICKNINVGIKEELKGGFKKMRFKCNTFDCQKTFELEYSEEDIKNKGCPICPYCKDKNNKSYRIE